MCGASEQEMAAVGEGGLNNRLQRTVMDKVPRQVRQRAAAEPGRSAAIVVCDRSAEDEMEIRKTLYVTSREEWRAWLTKHYQAETEVWLIYYKKHTGRPRISYDEAVEEALCFGWIDSIGKRMDNEKFAQCEG